MNTRVAPTLIFGWGNPSRGDDALGPRFVELFEQLAARHPEWGEIDCLTDFQLQVEHALDLQGRQRVLFVDASLDAAAHCTISPIRPGKDGSFTSHSVSPQSILQVYAEIEESTPPPSYLLSIPARQCELGAPLSESATQHLESALQLAADWQEDLPKLPRVS